MKLSIHLFSLYLLCLFTLSCSSASFANSKTLEIMAYNVENLFDTKHDKVDGVSKNDFAFLPNSAKEKRAGCAEIKAYKWQKECFETDWNDEKLKIKIDKIVDVIRRERITPPDFLAVTEIENKDVTKMLADALGYKKFEISQGPDKRGIETALIYNEDKGIKFVSRQEHEVTGETFKEYPTRNILEVEFLIGEKHPLTIFVNHWPSQGGPTISRIAAAEVLKKRVQAIKKANPDHYVIATGDFNTIPQDAPNPISQVILKDTNLFDMHEAFVDDRSIDWSVKNAMAPGTYFYSREMTWNLLDRFFLSENFLKKGGMQVIVDSYLIYAPSFITTDYKYTYKDNFLYGSVVKGTPNRYDHNASSPSKAGYSDHFPIIVRFKYE